VFIPLLFRRRPPFLNMRKANSSMSTCVTWYLLYRRVYTVAYPEVPEISQFTVGKHNHLPVIFTKREDFPLVRWSGRVDDDDYSTCRSGRNSRDAICEETLSFRWDRNSWWIEEDESGNDESSGLVIALDCRLTTLFN